MSQPITPGEKSPPGPVPNDAGATLPFSTLGQAQPTPVLPQVPGYDILAELGRGGMGVVYKAKQLGLNRLVALKMILAGSHASADDRQRFLREAEAVARLHHPCIVQIYDIGEQAGLPFFSLEYCAGGSLGDLLDGTPLPSRSAAELVSALARAVAVAHQAGIVHRDLKPANVLLASRELVNRNDLLAAGPRISDFGLAKRLDQQGNTRTGSIVGTPSYMSPEQARGSKEVGVPADIYALGAILYELLTGRPPFRAVSAMDTIWQVVHNDPVPPSQLQPRLSRDLETITLKCLQKDPRRRYASAADLADDLDRWLAGEPIRARPVGPLVQLGRWIQRKPAVAVLLLLLTLTLLVGFLNLNNSLASVRSLARHNQVVLVESLAGRIDERLRSNTQAVKLLARAAEVRTLLSASVERRPELMPAVQEVLQGVLLANEDFSAAFVLAADGLALASTNPKHPGRSYAFRDYYRQAMAGHTYQSKVLIGTSTQQAGMYYSAPVRDSHERILGVVVIKFELARLWQLIAQIDVQADNRVVLLDEDGILIAHSNPDWLWHSAMPLSDEQIARLDPRARFQRDRIESVDVPALAKLQGVQEAGSVDYYDTRENVWRTLAYAPLAERAWVLANDLDRDAISGAANGLAWQGGLALGGLTLIMAVTLLVLANRDRLTRRLEQWFRVRQRGQSEVITVELPASENNQSPAPH